MSEFVLFILMLLGFIAGLGAGYMIAPIKFDYNTVQTEGKPIIRHCKNCKYCKRKSCIGDGDKCVVKYIPLYEHKQRTNAIFCRYYNPKESEENG